MPQPTIRAFFLLVGVRSMVFSFPARGYVRAVPSFGPNPFHSRSERAQVRNETAPRLMRSWAGRATRSRRGSPSCTLPVAAFGVLERRGGLFGGSQTPPAAPLEDLRRPRDGHLRARLGALLRPARRLAHGPRHQHRGPGSAGRRPQAPEGGPETPGEPPILPGPECLRCAHLLAQDRPRHDVLPRRRGPPAPARGRSPGGPGRVRARVQVRGARKCSRESAADRGPDTPPSTRTPSGSTKRRRRGRAQEVPASSSPRRSRGGTFGTWEHGESGRARRGTDSSSRRRCPWGVRRPPGRQGAGPRGDSPRPYSISPSASFPAGL
jgi:hypothetical protein